MTMLERVPMRIAGTRVSIGVARMAGWPRVLALALLAGGPLEAGWVWEQAGRQGGPGSRAHAVVVWTGREMIVWGGSPSGASGGRLEPSSGGWSAMPVAAAPGGGMAGGMAWTGEALYVLYDGLFRAYETGPYSLDGLPDDWQYAHFGAQVPEGAAGMDPDGDGLANDGEFGLGTDPNDPTDGDGGFVRLRVTRTVFP